MKRAPRADSPALRRGFGQVGILRIPQLPVHPVRAIITRIGYAIAALATAVLVVYLDRDGYTDSHDGTVSLLDAVYYATVSLSTTGYGDIAPITAQARLVNIAVITPLRVFFLIVLVGTTLAALTEDSRQAMRIQRWRRRAGDHVVVIGYGTKGRAAVDALAGEGYPPDRIVVVDTDLGACDAAAARGLITLHGSATESQVLRLAAVHRAGAVVVATGRDDTAVLATLTARHHAPRARITAAVREAGNAGLLRRCGADTVVVTSQTTGRLLGVARTTPRVVDLIEDMLTPESGFALAQRPARPDDIGRDARELPELVLGIVRDQHLHRVGDPGTRIRAGDELLALRRIEHNP
ncbi:potassium channel family protein [Nocardia jiangsuensis]|uniref:Potassium channel family protein n=1 Tax=Nocardia jiangsuensis TaxID=1691563 RepID=A0ABV8DQ55_9NOCA